MSDPVVQLLAKQSKSRLAEMRVDATRQIEDLRQQVAWIERAIAEKGGAEEPRDPGVTITGRRSQRGGVIVGRRRRTSGKRATVTSILATEPDRSWSNSDVWRALEESGMDSTIESVRVLLRRMLEAGEVVKAGDGYKLPSEESAPDGAAPDAQMSDPGYGEQSALAPSDGSR